MPTIEHTAERVKLDLWYINNWSLWLAPRSSNAQVSVPTWCGKEGAGRARHVEHGNQLAPNQCPLALIALKQAAAAQEQVHQ